MAMLRPTGYSAPGAIPQCSTLLRGPIGSWAASLGILDLPAGVKISGSGFPLYTGAGARLIRALANFMLDLHTREHGYQEVAPPYLVSRAALTGTGQLPKFAEEVYASPADDLFLIPTAEVPVTNIHREEILELKDLPAAYVAFTPCFRREAFSHGKDTRGLIRVHQFDKVELVRIVQPQNSPAEHEQITGHAEAVLRRLGLPYRVIELAAGDTGFASARTYDLEVWAAGVGTWLEVSSSSTFTDYPGPPGEHPVSSGPQSQARTGAHLECLGRSISPHYHRAAGEQPGGRRVSQGTGSAGALHGRRSFDSLCVATGCSDWPPPWWLRW